MTLDQTSSWNYKIYQDWIKRQLVVSDTSGLLLRDVDAKHARVLIHTSFIWGSVLLVIMTRTPTTVMSCLFVRCGSKCQFPPSCSLYFCRYYHSKACFLHFHYRPMESWVSLLILSQYPCSQICHHGCFWVGFHNFCSHVALHACFSVYAAVEN